MDASSAIAAIIAGRTLTRGEARETMRSVMAGEATAAQLGALLATLHLRGETVDEIVGFAEAMREAAVHVPLSSAAVDIVGTGGSRVDPFNISTVSSVVAAAAGARVAKHGNRAATGRCGSADVLEALGVRIDLGPEDAARCVDEVGMAFLFAPRYHPAMRHASPVRREIRIRTVFNVLGPISNPARVRHMVLGVATPQVGETIARALGELGADHVLVVHGEEGLDDISPTGPTRTWELRGGAVTTGRIEPAAYGLPGGTVLDIESGDAAANAAAARSILRGERGPRRSAVVLNGGAALYVNGMAQDLREGVRLAAAAIDSGEATATLERFVATSQRLGSAAQVPS
ncbi:MAG: anthranilate phosphoribosyltransferase [Chloroflexi bacterium]|nr:anthranilate phosphoribosyltransferase [Chloroflexota bacterium]